MERGGGGKSYDGEKAWSSITHSMRSGKKKREGRRKNRKEMDWNERQLAKRGEAKMEYI